MKPIPFNEMNVEVAKDQAEYQTLPAYVEPYDRRNMVQVVSCWKLSWRERLQVMIFGKVWLSDIT